MLEVITIIKLTDGASFCHDNIQRHAEITTHFVLMPEGIWRILTDAHLKLWNLGMFDVITISWLTFEMTFKKCSGAGVLESADRAAADVDTVRSKRLFCQWGKHTADLINMDLVLSRKIIHRWFPNCGTDRYLKGYSGDQ